MLGLDLTTKKTRRREFLEQMERGVPWGDLVALIEPHSPHSKTNMPLYLEFAQPPEGLVRLPDESTILRFRHLLEKHGLAAQMFAAVQATLSAQGLMLKTGSVIDATLIHTPSSTQNNAGTRDPEMHQTRLGRIGALICGENTNALARFALMSQGENVHISSFSPRFPTHPAGAPAYDLEASIRLRAGAHAFEGKLFNIVSSSYLQPAVIDMLARGTPQVHRNIDEASRSVSMILGPDGALMSEVIRDEEGIAYATIDIAKSVVPKQFQDVVGYWALLETAGADR